MKSLLASVSAIALAFNPALAANPTPLTMQIDRSANGGAGPFPICANVLSSAAGCQSIGTMGPNGFVVGGSGVALTGITPGQVGAVNKAGDTMTGPLIAPGVAQTIFAYPNIRCNGDDTFDDAPGINAAIVLANGLGGRQLLFPTGADCRTKSSIILLQRVSLVGPPGAGNGVGAAASVRTATIRPSVSMDAVITQANLSVLLDSVGIENLQVDGRRAGSPNAPSTGGLTVNYLVKLAATGSRFKNNAFQYGSGTGFYGVGSGLNAWVNWWSQNYFYGNGDWGFHTENTDSVFESNYVSTNGLKGVAGLGALATQTPSVSASGTGYAVGDVLTVAGGTLQTNGYATKLKVIAVNGSGAITSAAIYVPGSYSTAPSGTLSVTGGAGSGATFGATYTSNNTTGNGQGGDVWTQTFGNIRFIGNQIETSHYGVLEQSVDSGAYPSYGNSWIDNFIDIADTGFYYKHGALGAGSVILNSAPNVGTRIGASTDQDVLVDDYISGVKLTNGDFMGYLPSTVPLSGHIVFGAGNHNGGWTIDGNFMRPPSTRFVNLPVDTVLKTGGTGMLNRGFDQVRTTRLATNYTFQSSGEHVYLDATSGVVTSFLPVCNADSAGSRYSLTKTDSTGNTAYMTAGSGNTLSGVTNGNVPLTTQGQASGWYDCDGVNGFWKE